jgi:hypothetical protein
MNIYLLRLGFATSDNIIESAVWNVADFLLEVSPHPPNKTDSHNINDPMIRLKEVVLG